MRLPTVRLAPVFGILIATPAVADDTQLWISATVNVGLGGPWRVSNETIRRAGEARGLYEIESNTMIGYKIDRHVTAWLGYTFDPTYSRGTFVVREHRFRQQVNFDNVARLGPVRLGGRLRLEERWRENAPGTAWRLRPQVKASLPVAGKVNLSLSHESFIDLNTNAFQRVAGEERMRNAVALSAPLAKRLTVEVGYLNQYGFVPGRTDTDDHVLTMGLTGSF